MNHSNLMRGALVGCLVFVGVPGLGSAQHLSLSEAVDSARAQAALARALNRLKVSGQL